MLRNTFIFALFALVVTMLPELAMAQDYVGSNTEAWDLAGGLACRIARAVESDIARSIATFGIIFMGIGAFLGKLNWGTVLTTALGVFIIFGVGYIISSLDNAGTTNAGEVYSQDCGAQ